jgi:glycerol uptake facilitator-like aquaporin
VQGFWGDAWIYYVGPIIGALVAAIGYTQLYLPMRREPEPA